MKVVEFDHEITNGLSGKDRKVVQVVTLKAALTENLEDVTQKVFKGNIVPTTWEFKRGRRSENEPDRSLCDFVNSLIIARTKANYENPVEKRAKLEKQREKIMAELAKLEALESA